MSIRWLRRVRPLCFAVHRWWCFRRRMVVGVALLVHMPFDEPPVPLLSFSLADGERFAGLDTELNQLAADHRRNVHYALVRQRVHDLISESAFHLEAIGVGQ